MTLIAPHMTAFLQERLPNERRASPNTCDSYAYAFRLLFEYTSEQIKVSPSQLTLEHLDASLILSFLNYLETARANSPGSRNIRLAAVKSFMRYMQYRVPSALEQIHAFLQFRQRKPILDSSNILPPSKCNPSWMLLTPRVVTASETGQCYIFALREGFEYLSLSD